MPASKPGPKYVRVKNAISQEIRAGRLAPGDQVHSISRIMDEFHVSKVTAVRALAELEKEGLVRREHGRGTFVARPERSAAGRGRSVSVIVPDMKNPFHIEVVEALERRLRQLDVAVELVCTGYLAEVERSAFERASNEAHIAGAVLISTPVPHQIGLDVPPRLPLVVIDYCPPDLMGKCVFISCDNFGGGHEAAAHLASLGHTRIGQVRHTYSSQERSEGFGNGLEERGLTVSEEWILSTELGTPIGDDLVDWVRREHLTALFALNDMLAMQAVQLLRGAGYDVPGDISLVGYDDVPAAKYIEVPLTTVGQHEELIGRRAADCLMEGLELPNRVLRPREVVIVPQLVVRASTAPPRSTE